MSSANCVPKYEENGGEEVGVTSSGILEDPRARRRSKSNFLNAAAAAGDEDAVTSWSLVVDVNIGRGVELCVSINI